MQSIKLAVTLVLLAVFGSLPSARAVDAATTGADAFISDLGGQAIATLTDHSVAEDERERRFRILLNANFDVPFIGQFVLGRYWPEASEAQRGAYLEVFEDSLVRAYTRRFLDYSGEEFAVGRVVPDESGALVTSTLTGSDGEPVRIDWRLRGDSGSFRIVDVIVEGVSMAQTQREEYGAVIDQNGGSIDALIEALRAKSG
jgi:phospholipid transport system substrate-binding protein